MAEKSKRTSSKSMDNNVYTLEAYVQKFYPIYDKMYRLESNEDFAERFYREYFIDQGIESYNSERNVGENFPREGTWLLQVCDYQGELIFARYIELNNLDVIVMAKKLFIEEPQ